MNNKGFKEFLTEAEFKQHVARTLAEKRKFSMKLDDLPLDTCDKAGVWMECEVIQCDPEDLKKTIIMYRIKTPEKETKWVPGTLEEAGLIGLEINEIWKELRGNSAQDIDIDKFLPE